MGLDRRQDLAHLRLLPELLQILAGPRRLQLVCMLIGILDRLILLYDLRRCLLTHSGNSGDII